MTGDWDDIEKEKKQTEEEARLLLKCEKARVKLKEEELKEMLKQPDIFNRYIKEFEKLIVGEERIKKLLFLSFQSARVLNVRQTPHTIVSAVSDAGKDYCVDAILSIFPEDEIVRRGRISPTALDYMMKDIKDWNGKKLYIEDIQTAVLNSTSFKLLASKKKLQDMSLTITVKNKAHTIIVKGQPHITVTFAESEPNQEIINRFNVETIDISKEQTKKIRDFILNEATETTIPKYDEKFRKALGILKNRKVVIPFAKELKDEFDCYDLRIRRNLPRFLDLIRCSGLFHQYQREIRDGHIVANNIDLEIVKSCFDFKDNIKLTAKEISALKSLNTLGMAFFSVSDCFGKTPIASPPTWYKWINKFAKEKLIEGETVNPEGAFQKPKTIYHITIKGQKYLERIENKLKNISN